MATKNRVIAGLIVRVSMGKNTKNNVHKKLLERLSFLQIECNNAACFLPKYQASKHPLIMNKGGVPKFQVASESKYMVISNHVAFAAVQLDDGHTIKALAVMGFNENLRELLENAFGGLHHTSYMIFYKHCQESNTVTKYALLSRTEQDGNCIASRIS